MAPNYNYDMSADLSLSRQSVTVRVDGTLNMDKRRSFYLAHNMSFTSNKLQKTANLNIYVNIPLKNLDHKIQLQYRHSPDEFLSSALLQSSKTTIGEMNIHVEKTAKKRTSVGKLHYAGRQMGFTEEATKLGDNHYRQTIDIRLQHDQTISCVTTVKTSPDIELDLELISPFTDHLNVKGLLADSSGLFSGIVNFVYGTRYRMDLAGKWEVGPGRVYISQDFDVRTPARHYNFSSSLDFEKWEVVKVRFAGLSIGVTISKMAPALAIRYDDTDEFLQYDLAGTFGKCPYTEIASVCHCETFMSLQSSDQFIKNFKISIKAHNNQIQIMSRILNQIEMSAKLTMDEDKEVSGRIVVSTNRIWTDVDAIAEFTSTPGRFPLRSSTRLTYKDNILKVVCIKNDHKVNLDFNDRKTNMPGIDVTITVTDRANRNLLGKASVKLDYKTDGARSSTEGVLSVMRGSNTTTMTMYREQVQSPVYKNTGNMTLTFSHQKPVQSIGLQWDRTQDGDDIKTNAALDVDGYKLNLMHASKWTGLKRNTDVELMIGPRLGGGLFKVIYVESPHTADFIVTWKASETQELIEILKGSLNFNGIEFDVDIAFLRSMKLMTSYKKGTNQWISIFNVFHTDRDTDFLKLNTKISSDGSGFEGNVAYKDSSPHFNKVNIDIRKDVDKWDLSINTDNRKQQQPYVTLSAKINLGTKKKMFCDIESNIQGLQKLYIDVDFSGNMSGFKTRAEILHNSLADTILLDLNIDVADLENLKVKADLKSPFKWADHIRVVYSHKIGPGNDISNNGNFKIPGFKLSLLNQFKHQSWNSFNTKTEVMYGLHQKVALATSFESSDKTSGLITIETPYTGAEHLTLKVSYEGPIKDCKANVEIGLDKECTISILTQRYHERDIHFLTKITTPFRNYKSMGIDFNVVGYVYDYKHDWAFTLEEKRLSGQNIFRWKGRDIDYTTKMETPFTSLENLLFSIQHEGPIRDFKTSVNIGWGKEQRISITTERYHERDIHFMTKINTPFKDYEMMGIDFNFVGFMNDYKQDWAFTLADKCMAGQNHFHWKGTEIAYASGMQTPFEKFENLLFIFQHRGQIRDCKTNMTIGWNKGQNISISIQRYHDQDIHFTTNITTPFKNYKTMGVASNFVGYMDDYNQDWTFIQEEKCLSGQNIFRWKGTKIEYTSSMQTPFVGFENLFFTFKHEGLIDKFEHMTTFEYAGGKSSIAITFSYAEGNVTGTTGFHLSPLFRTFMRIPDDLSLSIDHSGNMQNFQNQIQLNIDDISYSSGSVLKIEGYNVEATAFLLDPTNRLSISFRHTGQFKDFRCKYVINIFDRMIKIVHELKYDENVEGRVEVETTFDKLKHGLISFSHVWLNSDFTNNAVLQMNENEYRATSKLTLNMGDSPRINYDVAVFLPHEYRLTISHKGPVSNIRTGVVLKHEDSVITSNTKLIVSEMGFDASSSLSTPFVQYKDIQAVFKHSKRQDKIQTEGSFGINKMTGYDVNFMLQHGLNVSAVLDLSTPSHSLTIKSIQHRLLDDFQNTIDVRFDSVKYACESQFKFQGAHLIMKVDLTVPQEYSLTLHARTESSDFHGSLDVAMNGQNIHMTTDLKRTTSNIDATFKVLTPFSTLERQVLRFSHTGYMTNFKTSGYLETSLPGFDTFGFNIKYSGVIAQFTTNAELHTPFIAFKTASLGVNYEAGMNYLRNKLRVNYNRASITSTLNFEQSADNIKASAILDSSFSGYEKFIFKVNKEGTMNNLQSGVTLNTPLQFLSRFQLNVHHRAYSKHMSTGVVLNINDNNIKASTDVHMVKGFEVSASLELPLDGLEKFTFTANNNVQDEAHHAILHIETPFKHFESVDFRCKVLLTLPKVEFSMITSFIKPIEVNFKNRLVRNGMTTSASLFHPELRVNLVHSMSRTITKIAASGSIETSIDNLGRFAYTCALDGSEEDMLHFTAKVDHPFVTFANPGIQISIKLMEEWYKDLEVMAIITTLSNEQPPINLNVLHKYSSDRIYTSAYVTQSKRKITAAFEYSSNSNWEEWTGLVEVPIDGFERFTFRFRHSGRGIIQTYSGQLETPLVEFKDPSFDVDIEQSGQMLKITGSFTTPFKWLTPITGMANYDNQVGHISVNGNIQANEKFIQFTSSVGRADNYLKSQVEIITGFSGFENFGCTFVYESGTGVLMVNLDAILPKALGIINPKLRLVHYGSSISDFSTEIRIQAPVKVIKPISLSIKHKANRFNFDTELGGSYGTLSYTGVMRLVMVSSGVEFSTSVTTPTKDMLGLDLIHINDRGSLSTLLKVRTPYQQYADPELEFIHESFPSLYSSSLKVITPFKHFEPVTVTMEIHGDMGDLITNIRAQCSGQTISLNGAFEKKGRNAKASAELHTPFINYEHFGFAFSHNENSLKVRTTGNIVLPFRQYVSPSFDIDHRGDVNDFRTRITIVTPYQDIDPIVVNINHKGQLKDLQTTMHSQYQGRVISVGLIFKVSSDGSLVSGLVDASALGGDRFLISFKHQRGDNVLLTQFEIDAAQLLGFHKIAIEADLRGTLSDFHIKGKLKTPFSWTRSMALDLTHKGILNDFHTKGSIDVNDMKSEGEIQYRWKIIQAKVSHEAYAKLATPWEVFSKSELALSQSVTDLAWSGSLTGSYNRESFHAEYMLTFESQKYVLDVTVKQPSVMGYSIVIDPAAHSLLAVLNWDKSSNLNIMKIEGSLINLRSNMTNDHQFTVKIAHPQRNIIFQIGRNETHQRSYTSMHIQWGHKRHEKWLFEMEKTATSQHNSVRKITLVVLGTVTKMQEESHRGRSGHRYLTKLIIKGRKTLTAITDTTTTPTGFRTVLILDHPSQARRYQLSADGTSHSDPTLYQGTVTVEYVDTMDITWKVADASSAAQMSYVVEATVKHPRLNTDLRFLIADSIQVFSTSVVITHQVEQYPEIRLNVHSQLNKQDNSLDIQAVTPGVDINIRHTTDSTNRQRWVMTATTDSRTITADVRTQVSPPMFDTVLTYGPQRTVHIVAGRVSNELRLEVYRLVSGKRQVHMLARHARWDDISLHAYRQVRREPKEEIDISISFDETRHVIVLQSNTDPGSRTHTQVYQDAVRYTCRLAASSSTLVQRLCDDVKHEIVTPIGILKDVILAPVSAMVQHDDYYLAYPHTVLHSPSFSWLTPLSRFMSLAVSSLRSTSAAVHREVVERIPTTQLHNYMKRHPKPLLDVANYVRVQPIVRQVVTGADFTVRTVATFISTQTDWVAETLNDTHQRLSDQSPESWAALIISKFSLTSHVDDLAHILSAFRSHLLDFVDSGLAPLRDEAWTGLNLNRTSIRVWVPERGNVCLEVYRPETAGMEVQLMVIQEVFHGIGKMARYVRVGLSMATGILHGYKARSRVQHLLPPFEAHAMVVGGKHYLTFDGRLYDFTGECSYLLARDIIDNTFSITINYVQGAGGTYDKKSLTITHNDHEVEIHTDFQIIMDGHGTELPVSMAHTAVYQVGNALHVENSHGMRLTCEMPYDICTVSLSGWYFGRTAGLLGNFNNEPTDDLRSVTGTRAISLEALADSWTVGEQCQVVNHAVYTRSHANQDACTRHFLSGDSTLKPCFTVVDPAVFMTMCVGGDVCQVAASYARQCSVRHVVVPVPGECVHCDLPGDDPVLTSPQSATLVTSHVTRTADIIFTVSHGICNHDIISRLPDVTHHLEDSLNIAKFQNVRFGLVGYGGSGTEAIAHAHTLNGHLTHTRTPFSKALNHFWLKAPQLPVDESMPEVEFEDSLAGLEFAARYPYRPGASKMLVLVPCGGCDVTNISFETLKETLRTQNIRLIVLMADDLRLQIKENASPKSTDVFGLDWEHVYKRRDMTGSQRLGDTQLRHQMAPPKNLCASLAEQTGGVIFNSGYLTRTWDHDSFLHVFTQVSVTKAAPVMCQTCQCVAETESSGSGRVVCHSC